MICNHTKAMFLLMVMVKLCLIICHDMTAIRQYCGELPRAQAVVARPDPYILHVGGNGWYKNRSGVLRILAALGLADGRFRMHAVDADAAIDLIE